MKIEKASIRLAESYAAALDEVAREGKYLAADKGYTLSECISFMRFCASTDSVALFLTDGDRVAGWCDIVPARGFGTGSLGIGLKKEYRGKGEGTRLLEEAISLAKPRFRKVVLYVREDNARAVGMYLSHGFVIKRKYAAGRYKKVPAPVLKMLKKL